MPSPRSGHCSIARAGLVERRESSATPGEAMTSPAPPPPADPVRWLNNQPYLLLTLTAVFWAGNIVLARYVAGHVPPMTLSFVRWIGALLLLLPFSIGEFSSGFTLKFDALTLATLIYVMIFPSTLAYLFFNRGIALIGPNRAAPFFHLVPVFGSAMAILLLGEQPRLFHLVGYLLVLAGVVIASRQASAAV